MARESDYVAPMVYPSHWGPGEYNVANPNSEPYEIVLRSLRDFRRQTRGTGARVVPWLQDFTLGVTYGPAEVRSQIQAARRDGIDEFILWDPTVTYTSEALDPNAKTSTRGLAQPHEGEPVPRPRPRRAEGRAKDDDPAEGHCRPPSERARRGARAHAPRDPRRPGRRLRPDPRGVPHGARAALEPGLLAGTSIRSRSGRLGSVPAGKTPVVLTFDDSTQFQFSYDARGNIKPDTAIGILLDFKREHPAFPLAGTFYVNREPFAGVARGQEMLRWLVDHGFELGNHTKDHMPVQPASGPDRGSEGARPRQPGDRGRRAGLPRPDDGAAARSDAEAGVARACDGRWNGRTYNFNGVMLIGAGPAPSPFGKSFDRAGIPRIRSGHLPWNGEADFGAWYWLSALKQNPERRYVSDGDPATIAFPRALQKNLRRAFSSRARAY